jgi:hypothetical protein
LLERSALGLAQRFRSSSSGLQRPQTDDELRELVLRLWGVRIPDVQVCPNHTTPWRAFADAFFARSPVTVWKASRGFGGKTFLLAVLGLTEAVLLRSDVAVLGGSGQQSARVHEYMGRWWALDSAPRYLLTSEPSAMQTRLTGGNVIRALMASSRSVRGPHEPRLRCVAAGTMVRTPLGSVDIACLSVGDRVYSFHEGRIVETRVTGWRRTGVEPTIVITASNGHRLCATPDHPVLSHSGWRRADETAPGSVLYGLRESHQSEQSDQGATEQGQVGTVHRLFPQEHQLGCEEDVQLRGSQGPAVGGLPELLQRSEAEDGVVLRGLWRTTPSADDEALPVMSLDVDERARRVANGCSESYSERRVRSHAEQSRASGPRAFANVGSGVQDCRAGEPLGAGHPGRHDGNRSARGLLARQGASEAQGHEAGEHAGRARLQDDRTQAGSDAPVVEDLEVRSVTPGLRVPVYDISVAVGQSFIANGFVVHNCDEIDEMDLGILDAALGQPMATNGIPAQTVLSSTHQYADGTMAEILKRAGERSWPVATWCYRETMEPHGWLPLTEIERKRAEVTEAMFASEYDLEEPNPETRAIAGDKVAAMFRRELGHYRGGLGEYIEVEGPAPGGRYGTGADWARKKDWTIIPTFRFDVRPARLVAYERMQRLPWPVMIAKFDERVARYPGGAAHDGTGLGDVVDGTMKSSAEAFMMVGRARSDLISEYVAAVERGEFLAPHIDSAEAAHRLASVDDLYGSGHLPDDIAAAALAYRAGAFGTLRGEAV